MMTFENATYPTNSTAPEFAFTWEYPFHIANESAPAKQAKPLIHAFPQASIGEGGVVPLTLEDLGELTLEFAWTTLVLPWICIWTRTRARQGMPAKPPSR
jgi:hypothetical protein